MKQNIVVLTGAGISAESGLKTFRDTDGLWEGYNIQDVATPEAWARNPLLVQQFYNERRKQVRQAKPNSAHADLAMLEAYFNVQIITQNIDDLHERAGSSNVLHLHGLITKAQSQRDPKLIYPVDGDTIKEGSVCRHGLQLRPHVVWFGEAVPMIEQAAEVCAAADVFILIGTSLAVYPAAGLIDFVPQEVRKYIVDPKIPNIGRLKNTVIVNKNATEGMAEVMQMLQR